MKIKILTAGGTIDKVYFDKNSDYQVGDSQAGSVLQRANVAFDYEVESILRKDSLDLTVEDRKKLRKSVVEDACGRIVITHGTDTMIETAKTLRGVSDKTIVLTGSMYPAKFRDTDAVFNMGCAVTAAQILPPGIYIAMNGRVFDPFSSRKNQKMKRFEELD